jgi:UMF1 family MFS transporter
MSAHETRPLLARSTSSVRARKYPRQILSFYAYSISSGVYSTVALVLFLPVLLEDIARQHGRLKSNHDVACLDAPGQPCAVDFLGSHIDTASFSLFVSGISLAAQVLVLISIGDFADHISTRSLLILASSLRFRPTLRPGG